MMKSASVVLLFVLSLFASSASLIVRDYNEVRYLDNVTWPFMKEHLFNYNGEERANTNIFLGVYGTDACRSEVASPGFLSLQRHGGGNSLLPVVANANEFQHIDNAAVTSILFDNVGCGKIFFYRMGDLASEPTDEQHDLSYSEVNIWAVEKTRVSLTFINKFPYTVEIMWHEELSDEPMRQGYMAPNERLPMTSMLGHVFSIRKVTVKEHEDELRPIVDYFAVHDLVHVFSPQNRLETCEMDPEHWNAVFVDPAKLRCDNMEARFIEFSQHVWHQVRLGLNFVQPQLVRRASISAVGFEKRRLPADTYQWLKNWYDRQREQKEEIESTSGPCMNQNVAPSSVTHIDQEGKRVLEQAVKPILREWNGGGEIRMTSIYGIRRYTNGSVLRMHVDTAATHVVSAIINVDQKVEKDWPVLILDHDYNEHWVVMQPGDMLLYESAKALHGRPEPFEGDYYDNIFVHFQPVSGWDYDWI